MDIRLIIFDLAGTTIEDNDYVHDAFIKALDENRIKVSREEVNEVMGYPKPIAIEYLLKQKGEREKHLHPEYIQHIFKSFQRIMIEFYRETDNVREKTGVSKTFGALKERGIIVGIDTGFDRMITDTILGNLPWKKKGLLDISVCSDEVERGRPHPDMIFRAMRLSGIEAPLQVVKVGDTISDLEEGNSAGCRYTVGITTGAYSREALQKGPHTFLIDQIPEILQII